jgi:dynein heavy chain
MRSSEGEFFDFRTPVAAEGPVETWMLQIESEMRKTLRLIMKEGVFQYPKMDRVKFVSDFLGMIAVTTNQVWWTFEVEDAFRKVRQGNKHAMKQLLAKLSQQLNDLVDRVRQNLSENERKKVNMAIIIDVHARDIVDKFVRDSILDEREFAWESQLRFYWFVS